MKLLKLRLLTLFLLGSGAFLPACYKTSLPETIQGDPERGRQLIATMDPAGVRCGLCHTIPGVPAATGTDGPSLVGIGSTAAVRRPNLTPQQYLYQTLTEPQAVVVPGYIGEMWNYSERLTPQQLDDIIAYLLTLR
jgi:mono/diheme cytochrome c family protein